MRLDKLLTPVLPVAHDALVARRLGLFADAADLLALRRGGRPWSIDGSEASDGGNACASGGGGGRVAHLTSRVVEVMKVLIGDAETEYVNPNEMILETI